MENPKVINVCSPFVPGIFLRPFYSGATYGQSKRVDRLLLIIIQHLKIFLIIGFLKALTAALILL